MLELNLLCDLGSLAYATAQVVQLSTANLTAANNLELSNVRGMYREGLLYAYAVRNAANGYGLVYASVLLSNDDAFEYLNTLAVVATTVSSQTSAVRCWRATPPSAVSNS